MNSNFEQLIYDIRGAILDVYHELGPGLLESVYESALLCELKMRGLDVKTQVPVPIYYKGNLVCNDFRLDILVEDVFIIELKAVDAVQKVHFKQLRTYLKMLDLEEGLLVNFNTDDILKSIYHIRMFTD